MNLFYDNSCTLGLWDRILFLIHGSIRLRLWRTNNEEIKFSIQTKKLMGDWDE